MDPALISAAIAHFTMQIILYNRRMEETIERRRQRRRKFLLLQLYSAKMFYVNRIFLSKKNRSCWIKPRSSHWWDHVVPTFSDHDWRDNWRITKSTFDFICNRLEPYLKPNENVVRPSTTTEKKVAISLYKLTSSAEYRIIANQFGTHKSVVQQYVYQFCEAVIAEFSKEFLSFPTDEEVHKLTDGFRSVCGIPNIIGAIGGTHIPMLPPTEGYRDFINRKDWPSYNVLAIVDNFYRFRYLVCKHPGSSHDAAVLCDSAFFRRADDIIPKVMISVDGHDLPCMLLGDPAYPLMPWILKGYKGNVSAEEDSFNVYHSRGRFVVENTFGRFKARFRCLLKRIDINYKFVPKVVLCCAILHNIIETREEEFLPNWLEEVEQAYTFLPQPTRQVTRDFDTLEGAEIRDVLKTYMNKNLPILTTRQH